MSVAHQFRIVPVRMALALGVTLAVAACGGSSEPDAAAPTTESTVAETTTEPATSTTTTPTTTTTSTSTSTSTTLEPATTTAPVATTVPATTAAPATSPPPPVPAYEYCDAAAPLPAGAVVETSLTLDMMGDGTTDDLIEAYDVDGWSRLRLTTGNSVVSEIINPAIDGRYRPLGIASVLPGDSDELFAVIGEGSAAAEIGVFGIDSADCLFSYTHDGTSDDFTLLIRPSSPVRSGAFCFEGGIGLYGAEQRSDGTWDAYSSAYELASPWTLRYMGASDDYSEGLAESDLTPFELDCFGLML